MINQMKKILLGGCLLWLGACGGSSGDSSGNDAPTISSSSSSSVNSSVSPTLPQNLSATPGNGSATLNWSNVSNASGYHIYYATESNIQPQSIAAFENGTWIQNVTPPYLINSLTNGETYYFVVTAILGNIESDKSSEVSTTPLAVDLARQPTAQEVLVLELINRARFDPDAEASRYGIGLNDGISGTSISSAQKPPLAHNLLLIDAARGHSQWMLEQDEFSHTGVGGSSVTDRIKNADYLLSGSWTVGENIAWSGSSGSSVDLTQAAFGHHEGLFKSPGHRLNILKPEYREIGIGQKEGDFYYEGTNWRASMLTENFARSGSSYFLTGVVYEDANDDKFYNPGEGLDGVTITVDGKSHPVFSTGAYAIPLNDASYTVTISGAALGTPVNYSILVNGANVKLDVVKSGDKIAVTSW